MTFVYYIEAMLQRNKEWSSGYSHGVSEFVGKWNGSENGKWEPELVNSL